MKRRGFCLLLALLLVFAVLPTASAERDRAVRAAGYEDEYGYEDQDEYEYENEDGPDYGYRNKTEPVTDVELELHGCEENGVTVWLGATVLPYGATNRNVLWTVSNTDVAAVDADGEVTVRGCGETRITAETEDGGKTAVFTFTSVPFLPAGDADADGSVTAADARLALRCAVYLEDFDYGSEEFTACDIDASGTVSADDARTLLRIAVGLDEAPPAAEAYHLYNDSGVAVAPTCTGIGYTRHFCFACEHYIKTDRVKALGHRFGPATCTQPRLCAVCGAADGSPLGHLPGGDLKTKAAACTSKGSRTYTCARCGAAVNEETPALGHAWQDATCTEPAKCARCGAIQGAALGHAFLTSVTPATPSAKGYTLHKCARCGYSYKDGYTDYVPDKGYTQGVAYVCNKRTMILHRATCPSVKRMSSANKWVVPASYARQTLINMGYHPCHNCSP